MWYGYQIKCPNVYLNNNKLEYVEKAKYLGVAICNDLKDDENMLRHLHRFYASCNTHSEISQLFSWCETASI